MRKLTANKTKLYQLVAEFESLPPMRRVTFVKSFRLVNYWLKWVDRDGMMCEAFFATCGGRPVLLVRKRESSGEVICSVVHGLNVDDLVQRDMVEEHETSKNKERSPT